MEDSGPGLSDEQRSHLANGFFRVLARPARQRLGWSIVKNIAAVHGAEVTTARSAALGGLAVRVAFPLRRSTARDLRWCAGGERHGQTFRPGG